MCKNFSLAAPAGSALRLAISYIPWEGAQTYYKLQHALEAVLPGAQIIGDADVNLDGQDNASLRIVRLNDGRELLRLDKGAAAQILQPDAFEELVSAAMDNFNWRYSENGKVDSGSSLANVEAPPIEVM